MLEFLLDLAVGLPRGIQRYRYTLTVYTGDYFGARGCAKKILEE